MVGDVILRVPCCCIFFGFLGNFQVIFFFFSLLVRKRLAISVITQESNQMVCDTVKTTTFHTLSAHKSQQCDDTSRISPCCASCHT